MVDVGGVEGQMAACLGVGRVARSVAREGGANRQGDADGYAGEGRGRTWVGDGCSGRCDGAGVEGGNGVVEGGAWLASGVTCFIGSSDDGSSATVSDAG